MRNIAISLAWLLLLSPGSAAAWQFARDLHFGRVDGRAAGFAIGSVRAPLDATALADLPANNMAEADRESTVMDAELSAAVRRFQARHSLSAEGVLARETYQAFTAPPIIVNIPQFQLFAFRTTDDRVADIAQMPVFVSKLRYSVFRPFWDVTASIVQREMLAPMRADAGYLARNNLEIVEGGGDDAAMNGEATQRVSHAKPWTPCYACAANERPAVAVVAAAALRMVV